MINGKKFHDEQVEVQVTNNTKIKVQANFSLPKNKSKNVEKINFIQNKNNIFEPEKRINPKIIVQDDISKNKEIDFRKITTSPIVIVDLYILFRKSQ